MLFQYLPFWIRYFFKVENKYTINKHRSLIVRWIKCP